jgi:REP element-mobilizing transposase RayT
MIRLSFIIIAITVYCISFAADIDYNVKNIPQELLKDANAVKRMEHIKFEVHSLTSTTYKKKYAFTILNEKGDRFSTFVEFYDKLHKISSIEGSLYDGNGKLIKKLKSKDIVDLSAVGDGSLMDDDRKKVHSFHYNVYPYTVEYDAEIKFSHTFLFPGWYAQEDEFVAVENSSFTLVHPEKYKVRYQQFNYDGVPKEFIDKNLKVVTWNVANVRAIKKELYAPRWHELTTTVSLAPTDFQLDNYKGEMSTWKGFGKFIYELSKGRDVLPDDIKQQVKSLTARASSDVEKIKILYDYLQKNTRYISIQLGLGGWQPFEATYVAKKGYGDCKALSNYMYSLLKEAGINSHYTLIKSGSFENMLFPEFPSNQFDHVILCVPVKNDTIWLECTSQTDPFGYMGAFTGNRKALLITEEGGVVVNTKNYLKEDNLQLRKAVGNIIEDGSLQTSIETKYFSMQQDHMHKFINFRSKDKVKEILQADLGLPTYNLNEFKYTEKKNINPEIQEDLDIFVSNYATITGKRLFITPNLLNKSSDKVILEDRLYDLCINYAYKDVDTIEYQLPTGYKPESVPQDVSLVTKFGTYKSSIKFVEDKIIYTRIREQYSGRFSNKDYNDLVAFYNEIYKADRNKIVMVKNN